MKKRMLAVVIAGTMILQSGMTAFAVPNVSDEKMQEIETQQSEYSDAQAKYDALSEELEQLQGQCEALQGSIDEKNKQISDIEDKIEGLQEEMDSMQDDLEKKQAVYGERVRAIYKNGTPGYIDVLLNSTSFSDLLSNVQAISKIMGSDKSMMDEVVEGQKEIQNKQDALNDDINTIKDLKASLDEELQSFEEKKAAQEPLVEAAAEAKKNIAVDLAANERLMISYPASIINDSNSSKSSINDAITTLRSIRSQVTVIDSEVVDLIEKGKSRVQQIEAAEAAAAANANRGGSISGGSSAGGAVWSGNASETVNKIMNTAYSLQGRPYVYGATGPSTFDCSGFTQYVFRQAGIGLSRTTYTQVNEGRAVSASDAKAGDLVFFGSPSAPHHVGIYIGGGSYIHAPHTGDVVKISSLSGRSETVTFRRIVG